MKEKKNADFLHWPWNIVIYVMLLFALRLFAIPVILVLIWVQQKNNPHGVEEGYCLSRTRKRISWVAWSVLWLAVAGGGCSTCFMWDFSRTGHIGKGTTM